MFPCFQSYQVSCSSYLNVSDNWLYESLQSCHYVLKQPAVVNEDLEQRHDPATNSNHVFQVPLQSKFNAVPVKEKTASSLLTGITSLLRFDLKTYSHGEEVFRVRFAFVSRRTPFGLVLFSHLRSSLIFLST